MPRFSNRAGPPRVNEEIRVSTHVTGVAHVTTCCIQLRCWVGVVCCRVVVRANLPLCLFFFLRRHEAVPSSRVLEALGGLETAT